MLRRLCFAALSSLLVLGPACSGDDDPPAPAPAAATSSFDPAARFDAPGAFFDFPYPSDLRLTPEGAPDVAGFPDDGISVIQGVKVGAGQRKGFPVIAAGYFRFTKKLAPRDVGTLVDRGPRAPIMLIDVDDASPDRGKLLPVVAATPEPDAYVPEFLLAVGARPGIILTPRRRYAFVVTRAVGVEDGSTLDTPPLLASLARGDAAPGPLRDLYAPLWATLDTIGVPRADVVNATVFTTGDVVADSATLADRVVLAHKGTLDGFELEPDPTNRFPAFCHVRAKLTVPQFQKGAPPFKTEGSFEIGADGMPVKQRDETIGVSLSVPKQPMPVGGYPLVLYLHGSGGVSRQHVDGGDQGVVPEPGTKWPSEVLAPLGFAMAGAALPISPERVPGAKDFDYVNVDNIMMTRDLFRQGIIESRLFLTALGEARIPPATLAACSGVTLPPEEPAVRFSIDRLSIQGQSMGGMYANLLGAAEPRVRAVVPTGAGGYLIYFILQTPAVPNAAGLLTALLRAGERMNHLHPAMQIATTALEPIDPIVSAPRLARRPLAGHEPRSIYEPVGLDDSYFPTPIFDAMALAYGHPRAGDEVWPTMGPAQALVGLDAVAPYPVVNNLASETGAKYTGIVVQYAVPGKDGHGIYRRLEAVMHQYSCFHSSYRKTGIALVPPPAALGSPCGVP